jgi:uncharacterized membrane protein YcaP (DUF421 family)
MPEYIWFSGWTGIGRTLLVGTLAYVALITVLRISGKRTLSKMNAFDLVVTVALGSTLATVLLSKNVALAEGVAAFATLIGAQFLITWLSVRSAAFRKIIKSEPSLLLHRGKFCEDTMRRERVTRAEVFAAIRAQGIASLGEAEAVVLETDGSFTTMTKPTGDAPVETSALQPHLAPLKDA